MEELSKFWEFVSDMCLGCLNLKEDRKSSYRENLRKAFFELLDQGWYLMGVEEVTPLSCYLRISKGCYPAKIGIIRFNDSYLLSFISVFGHYGADMGQFDSFDIHLKAFIKEIIENYSGGLRLESDSTTKLEPYNYEDWRT